MPQPKNVVAELEPLTALLYATFDDSIPKAVAFFADRHRPVDASLFPNLVRYEVKEQLGDAGQIAYDDEVVSYERYEIANNGLWVPYQNYEVRILKSGDGQLPVPGRSNQMQMFYGQQLTLGLATTKRTRPSLNLVVLWSVDRAYALVGMRLSCPRSGQHTRESVEEYWNVPLPRPRGAVQLPSPTTLEDIPYELEDLQDHETNEDQREDPGAK